MPYQVTEEQRKTKLTELFLCEYHLPGKDEEKLLSLMVEYHDVFSLKNGEKGETNWVEMSIETSDAMPVRQLPRRVPFEVRSEIAWQLKKMQENKMIQASKSPWASPIVLVQKKDGIMRFCIEYRTGH